MLNLMEASVPEDLHGFSKTSVDLLTDFSGPTLGVLFFACLPKDEIYSEGRIDQILGFQQIYSSHTPNNWLCSWMIVFFSLLKKYLLCSPQDEMI